MIALAMPYHDNPRMLARHYDVLGALPSDLKRNIEVVVCDDASAEPPPLPPLGLGVSVRIFRIPPPHIPWSHRCASNIAASEARAEWLLLTDIDHIVPERTWRGLMELKGLLRSDRAYVFARENLDGSAYKPHPDSWLFTRGVWNTIGGYDERYRGHYGQNYSFITRVTHHFPIEGLPLALIRVSREDIPDASERVLTRKSDEAKAAIAALRRQFMREGSFYNDTRLSAKYVRVY